MFNPSLIPERDAPDEDALPPMILPSAADPHRPSTVALADAKAIRSFLRECVTASGVSLSEFARRLQVSKQSLHQVLNGRTKHPTFAIVVRIATAAGGAVRLELPR